MPEETVEMYRPTGPEELILVARSGFRNIVGEIEVIAEYRKGLPED